MKEICECCVLGLTGRCARMELIEEGEWCSDYRSVKSLLAASNVFRKRISTRVGRPWRKL